MLLNSLEPVLALVTVNTRHRNTSAFVAPVVDLNVLLPDVSLFGSFTAMKFMSSPLFLPFLYWLRRIYELV